MCDIASHTITYVDIQNAVFLQAKAAQSTTKECIILVVEKFAIFRCKMQFTLKFEYHLQL